MVDIAGVFQDSFSLYSKHYDKVLTAFLVLLLLAIFFAVTKMLLQFPQQIFCSDPGLHPAISFVLCTAPILLEWGLDMVSEVVFIFISFSLLVPFAEMGAGKKISGWTTHLSSQLLNAVQMIAYKIVLSLVIATPVILLVFLDFGVLTALQPQIQQAAGDPLTVFSLIASQLLIFLIVGLFVLLAYLVIDFFTMFTAMELVINKKNILQALASSVSLVLANPLPCVLFWVVWFLIYFAAFILSIPLACCICLGQLVILIVSWFILAPVHILSNVLLWQRIRAQE